MTSREIADFAVGAVLDDLRPTGPVIVLVNGMGATPLLELYGFNAEVQRCCPSGAWWQLVRSWGTM